MHPHAMTAQPVGRLAPRGGPGWRGRFEADGSPKFADVAAIEADDGQAGTDRLLTTAECARWLGLSARVLIAKVRAGAVPAVRLNSRTYRFDRKTILTKLQR